MNILFLADNLLSSEEILTVAKLYPFDDSKNVHVSILNSNDSILFNREVQEADIIVTNRTRVTETLIKQASNLLLICCLGNAHQYVDMTTAEKSGILIVDAQKDHSQMTSKLASLQVILSEVTRFIEGKPLNHLVRSMYLRTNEG